ncbi:MAG: SoxR reducing system RseC family protein [Spirochaetota bacterium]
MVEKARVISIDGERVTLSCSDLAGCKACSGSFCGTKQRSFDAANTNNLDLNPNDEVEVFVHPGKAILAGFMVLIFPLVLFVGGFLASGPWLGVTSEAARVAVGGGALVAGFAAVYRYNRRHGNSQMPSVLRRVSGADSSHA